METTTQPAPFKPAGDAASGGTHLQDYVTVDYADLVKVFGEPHSDGDGHKVDAEWVLEFADGTIATIYNYKDGRNYNGRSGLAVGRITDWHVGGFAKVAVEHVKAALGIKP